MNDVVTAFQNSQLFSKSEIIQSFELMMEHIENSEETGYTKNSIMKKIELCKEFLNLLKKCKLPSLTELYYFYDYEFTGNGIELNLCQGSDLKIDENGMCISEMTVTLEKTLLKIECDYVTIEEFAKIQEVTPLTVQQWIQRGKLRHAKKSGDDWLIPSVADKLSKGYQFVQYILEDADEIQIDEYPFVSVCDSIVIMQDDKDKKKFICIFDNYKSGIHERMELSRKEVEVLEYALISSGKAKADNGIRFVPTIDRNQKE